MNNNPSPGNKAGGLTTILEKSLGAVAKGGTTNLVDVYEYAEPVTAKGFVFMDTPGYDPVSATGQVAGGANMICFTTGRGSAYGCKPAPSLKLATNTPLFVHQEEDMDFNCGTIIDGNETIAAGRRALLRADPRDRLGEEIQERGVRLRRRRVRAVDHRRDDVGRSRKRQRLLLRQRDTGGLQDRVLPGEMGPFNTGGIRNEEHSNPWSWPSPRSPRAGSAFAQQPSLSVGVRSVARLGRSECKDGCNGATRSRQEGHRVAHPRRLPVQPLLRRRARLPRPRRGIRLHRRRRRHGVGTGRHRLDIR